MSAPRVPDDSRPRAGRAGARLRSRRLGLGLGQRRLGQDPRARATRRAAAARRRAALAHSLPHLHQGGGGQYGRAGVRAGWRNGRGSTDAALRAAIVGRPAPQPDARSGLAARQLFARDDRDAGRPENPDHPRLLRAGAASLSVRGQCRRRAFASSRSARRRDCSSSARGEALAALLREADGEARLAALAREAGADGFEKLLREALGAARRDRPGARLLGRRGALRRGARRPGSASRRARMRRRSKRR